MSTWISIKRPNRAPNAYGRSECRDALYAAFHDFRQQAQRAGWERREVDWAIMLLAGTDLRTANANTDTALALEQAMGKSDFSEIENDLADKRIKPLDENSAIGIDAPNPGLKLLEEDGAATFIEGSKAVDATPADDDVASTEAFVDTPTEKARHDSTREVMPTGPALPYDVDHLEAGDQKGPWKALAQLLKRP